MSSIQLSKRNNVIFIVQKMSTFSIKIPRCKNWSNIKFQWCELERNNFDGSINYTMQRHIIIPRSLCKIFWRNSLMFISREIIHEWRGIPGKRREPSIFQMQSKYFILQNSVVQSYCIKLHGSWSGAWKLSELAWQDVYHLDLCRQWHIYQNAGRRINLMAKRMHALQKCSNERNEGLVLDL